jgi:peptidyl-prolyl cis-trans isomerase B (cyclophilin B)
VWLKVYLDVGMCPQAFRTDRAIGDKSALCSDAAPLGRIVVGLYGDTASGTVATFTRLIESGAYTGTSFHKVIAGRYVKAGRQGQRRYGEVDLSKSEALPKNPDVVRALAQNPDVVSVPARRRVCTPCGSGCAAAHVASAWATLSSRRKSP